MRYHWQNSIKQPSACAVIKEMISSVEAWSACDLVAKRTKCISHFWPFYIVYYRATKNNDIGKNRLESASYNRLLSWE